MLKDDLKKVFEKPTLIQIALSTAAACFSLVAFGLFFADAVGDKGGDGLPAFKIAFDVMIDGLHFNVRAFIAYFIPLLCGAAVIFPFKEKKVFYASAFLLLAAGIVIFCMREIYLTKYSKELADMYRKAGVELAVPAIIAGTFSLVAAVLCLARGLVGVKFKAKKDSGFKVQTVAEPEMNGDEVCTEGEKSEMVSDGEEDNEKE